MALKTASGKVECPECFAENTVKNVMENEIVQCPDCGVDLEAGDITVLKQCLKYGLERQ